MLGRAWLIAALVGLLIDAAGAQGNSGPRITAQLGHQVEIRAVAFSPNERFVVTAAKDSMVCLWDAASGRLVRSFVGHYGPVSEVAFSADGKTVVSAGWDKTARIWQTATGKELRRLQGHSNHIQALAVAPNGRYIVTGDRRGVARLWKTSTGKTVRSYSLGSGNMFWAAAYSPNSRRVLLGDKKGSLLELDGRTLKLLRRLPGHATQIFAIVYSRDGKKIATTSRDNTVRIWNATSGKELRVLTIPEGVSSLQFLPDGRRIVTCSRDVQLWNIETGKEVGGYPTRSGWGTSVQVSRDGKRLLAGYFAPSRPPRRGSTGAAIWETETGKELVRFEGAARLVSQMLFARNGESILAVIGGEIKQWDLGTGKLTNRNAVEAKAVVAASFSADGRWLLTGSRDGSASLWNWATKEEIRRFGSHQSSVSLLGFSADGARIFTGCSDSKDERLMIWDRATGEPVATILPSHQRAALSPDGRRIASGGARGSFLWNVASGRELHRLPHGDETVSPVAFSPDGRRLVTGTYQSHIPRQEDVAVYVWDAISGRRLRVLAGHFAGVNDLEISPDGKYVLSASSDLTARVWSLSNGKGVHRLEGHAAGVNRAVFSPDGHWIATTSTDGTAKLWDARTGNELCTLIVFRDGSWAVVDPQGRFDGSDGGSVDGLHSVHRESIGPLARLKERYYKPGLLAEVTGFGKEPPGKKKK